MGKRGPRPIAHQDLYRAAVAFYRDFRELAGLEWRRFFDRKLYDFLKRELKPLGLTDEQTTKFRKREEMICNGRLTQAEREEKFRELERDMGMAIDFRTYDSAFEISMIKIQRNANPDALLDLLAATTAERVREVCETQLSSDPLETIDPIMLVNPGHFVNRRPRKRPKVLSDFAQSIHYYAEQFIAAKNHRKFPNGRTRKSTLLEKLWFLSRALAGAIYTREVGTVLNLIPSTRPDQITDAIEPDAHSRARRFWST
jgi:hypothetical protein